MDGRGILWGGNPVVLNGQKGILFPQSTEEEAFQRWQTGDFLGTERSIAKKWRAALAVSDYENRYQFFRQRFLGGKSLKNLHEVKARADIHRRCRPRTHIQNRHDPPKYFARSSGPSSATVASLRKAQIAQFASYFRFLYSVEVFFYLGLASDLISRHRPSNKIDLAYLYYLPFCKVFTSGDKLHEKTVPFFKRANQTFVRSEDLKADLAKLDAYYSQLPDEIKRSGLHRFAKNPPEDTSFLVTRLWDQYIPTWREWKEKEKLITPHMQEALRTLAEKVRRESQPDSRSEGFTIGETNYIHMESRARSRKGKWEIFGQGAK